jgi:hypothetical protein
MRYHRPIHNKTALLELIAIGLIEAVSWIFRKVRKKNEDDRDIERESEDGAPDADGWKDV